MFLIVRVPVKLVVHLQSHRKKYRMQCKYKGLINKTFFMTIENNIKLSECL